MNVLLKIVAALLAVLFGLAAALQYNDPDPLRWVAIYAAAAAACLLSLREAAPRWLRWGIGLVALGWAATLLPSVLRGSQFAGLFSSVRMMSPEVEEARELGGLLLTALSMAILPPART